MQVFLAFGGACALALLVLLLALGGVKMAPGASDEAITLWGIAWGVVLTLVWQWFRSQP